MWRSGGDARSATGDCGCGFVAGVKSRGSVGGLTVMRSVAGDMGPGAGAGTGSAVGAGVGDGAGTAHGEYGGKIGLAYGP